MKYFIVSVLLIAFEGLGELNTRIAKPNIHPRQLINNGKIAYHNQFQYAVSVQILQTVSGSDYYKHICSGSIVDRSFIITAASCYFGDDRIYRICAGCKNLIDENCEAQVRNVSKFIPYKGHPGYMNKASNDIAMLKLETPLEFNKEVNAIQLLKDQKISHLATVAGWGQVKWWYPFQPAELRYVVVTVLNSEECKRSNLTGLPKYFDDTMLCSDQLDNYESICPGDEGSPLTQENVLIGIASYRRGICGLNYAVSVYTKVSKFNDWIFDILKL